MAEFTERRRAQRVEAQLKLQVQMVDAAGQAEPATLETVNISTSGVYFRSDHFIPPMTKLALGLELKVPGPAAGEPDLALVQCEGLVVRTEPEIEIPGQATYEIAVFFTSVEPGGLQILEDHIDYLLTEA